MMFAAWGSLSIGWAADSCGLDLRRPPKVVVARDFRPPAEKCSSFRSRDCRVAWTARSEAPTLVDYRLRCAEGAAPAPPPPPAARDDQEGAELKKGLWIDGAAVIIPATTTCVPFATVRRWLKKEFPALSKPRTEPAENEPRLRVWSLRVDYEGYASVNRTGLPFPAKGPVPGKLPDAVCRTSLEVDGKRMYPKTQTILATCPGEEAASIEEGCRRSSGAIIRTDVRQLLSGSEKGSRHLKRLASADHRVAAAEGGAPVTSPTPAPTRRCVEEPRPVPLEHLIAVWKGERDRIRRTARRAEETSCTVVPAELDPDGLVRDLVARYWAAPSERQVLAQLWRADPDLGSALLGALDRSIGSKPALRADDLRRLVQAAMEGGPRGFTPGDVAGYDESRRGLLSRLQLGNAELEQIEQQIPAAAGTFEALRAEWRSWPAHAGARLADLESRRESVSVGLRDRMLRGGRRRSGNGLVLEIMQLITRIEQDLVHQLREEAAFIEDDLVRRLPALAVECRRGLAEGSRHIPAPTTLAQALEDPGAFLVRRDIASKAHHWLDELPCREVRERIEQLPQRVRNLEVESQRVNPIASAHPTLDEASRLIRRSDRWLRGTR